MNSIILLGRTTSQIELKQTPAGKPVVSFSLAVKRPFSKDTTDFFNIVAWDKQAEVLSKYCGKGDQLCIRGHLQTRTWKDQQGNNRYATEVVASEVSFCGTKSNNATNSAHDDQNASQPKYEPYTGAPDFEDIKSDDDLPF